MRRLAFPSRLAGPIVLAAALALAACQAVPLYGSNPAQPQAAVRAELAAIAIPPVNDRLSQIVRNELLFDVTGGGVPAAPRYELSLSANASVSSFGVGINRVATVTVLYSLAEIATGQVAANGRVSAAAEYEELNQAFANLSAREAAEERAARAAADLVWQALALALSARLGL